MGRRRCIRGPGTLVNKNRPNPGSCRAFAAPGMLPAVRPPAGRSGLGGVAQPDPAALAGPGNFHLCPTLAVIDEDVERLPERPLLPFAAADALAVATVQAGEAGLHRAGNGRDRGQCARFAGGDSQNQAGHRVAEPVRKGSLGYRLLVNPLFGGWLSVGWPARWRRCRLFVQASGTAANILVLAGKRGLLY